MSSGEERYLGVVNLLINKDKTETINKMMSSKEILIFFGIARLERLDRLDRLDSDQPTGLQKLKRYNK